MNAVFGGPDLHRPFVEKNPELDDLLSLFLNHDIAQDTGFLTLHSNFLGVSPCTSCIYLHRKEVRQLSCFANVKDLEISIDMIKDIL